MPSDATSRAASAFIAPDETYASIGRDVSQIALAHPSRRRWWYAMGLAAMLIGLFAVCLAWLFWEGPGIWGNNIPVTWALDIVAYDWWIGVACGGMLTSATLVLLGVEWRSSVNRITETMTVIAAAAAGTYPIIHLGRPWFFYWNLPYPNTLGLWPQFRSPLYWDAVNIISFLGVALTFWYIGLLPDFAALRDRAFERAQANQGSLLRAQIYGVAACGWRGSAAHWHRWTQTYRTLALLGVVVVIALQTGAAVMFAGTLEPGWHDTLQPVSFLFAALFAGLGVVAMLAVALRSVFALDALITERHLGVLASLLLGVGLIVSYCFAAEFFYTVLKGDPYDIAVLSRRFAGAHAWAWWTILFGALLPVHLFWFGPLRRSPVVLLIVGLLVAAGMWADHFMVIVVTLQHDFLPSAAHPYSIGLWAVATFAGSAGVFLLLLLMFLRYLPVVSILETRRLVPAPTRKRR